MSNKSLFNTFFNPIILFILFVLVFNYPSKSQIMGQNPLKKLSEQKELYYQKLIQFDKRMTKNQTDYDAKYYSLDLQLNPTTEILTGTVVGVYEVISSTLNQIDLNFWTGMTITDIHLSSSPATQLSYTHTNDLLVIDLGSTINQGQQVSLVISYHGSPQNSNYGSFDFDSYNGEPMIWTRSEPYGARAWWPCKDIPSDKADSVDIRVTVPDYLTVASNGTLRDTSIVGNLKTWWWHEKYPITTYLVSLNIYPYIVYYDNYIYNNNADTMKIHFYVFPDNYNTYYSINALVKDMIACFDTLFGPYPFIDEKYGQADDLGWGAMEHQTCSSFSNWDELTYLHELAHQWWGDLITCNSFHHIWLNEGFATYSEALWYEHAYPQHTASEYQMANSHYLGAGTIYVEDPHNEQIFFYGLTYSKASWVIHMLRHIMGDQTFFDFLHTYYSSVYQHSSLTTDEFKLLCEQASGLNLDKYFQQWIYDEYYPNYSYGYTISPQGNRYKIDLNIEQIQSNTGLFWMPIDIRVTTNLYDTVFVVWDSLQSQSFEFFTDDQPLRVELDPDNWILKETQHHFKAPYALNVILNKYYQKPGIDSIAVRTKIYNPENNSLAVKAIINNNISFVDSLVLFDDGFHQDSVAGDGIFGAIWGVPSGETYYSIDMMTYSLDSGYYSILFDAAQFSTVGPVVLDKYVITTTDTVINHDDVARFQFFVENESANDTVYNINSRLVFLDTFSTQIIPVVPEYGDVAPGEISVGDAQQLIRFNANSPDSVFTNIKMDIYSENDMFWSDTLSIFFTKDPAAFELINDQIPTEYGLKQNYPNPFNPKTTIEFSIPKTENIALTIYNLLGQELTTLVSENLTPGEYKYTWDASGFASGVYFYILKTDEYVNTKKLILLK